MIKINGKEIRASKDDSDIRNFVTKGYIKKIKDGEYIWAEKYMKDTEKNARRLYKRLYYPLYPVYYDLMKWLGIYR